MTDQLRPAASAVEAQGARQPIRAHVLGCLKNLSVPVDLCECGGRNFLPGQPNSPALSVAQFREALEKELDLTPDAAGEMFELRDWIVSRYAEALQPRADTEGK